MDSATLTTRGLAEAARHLAERDADLAQILRAHGPPPLWARPQGFATLIRIIFEQQVSLASARSLYLRIEGTLGRIAPDAFLAQGDGGLRALGLTRQKSAYCLAAARAVEEGLLSLPALRRLPDTEARAALMRVRGVGPWSADIYLLMALRRADVWPSGDLALAATLRRVKNLRGRVTDDRLRAIADRWRPYRAVAARMLWQRYLAGGVPAQRRAAGGARRPESR